MFIPTHFRYMISTNSHTRTQIHTRRYTKRARPNSDGWRIRIFSDHWNTFLRARDYARVRSHKSGIFFSKCDQTRSKRTPIDRRAWRSKADMFLLMQRHGSGTREKSVKKQDTIDAGVIDERTNAPFLFRISWQPYFKEHVQCIKRKTCTFDGLLLF